MVMAMVMAMAPSLLLSVCVSAQTWFLHVGGAAGPPPSFLLLFLSLPVGEVATCRTIAIANMAFAPCQQTEEEEAAKSSPTWHSCHVNSRRTSRGGGCHVSSTFHHLPTWHPSHVRRRSPRFVPHFRSSRSGFSHFTFVIFL